MFSYLHVYNVYIFVSKYMYINRHIKFLIEIVWLWPVSWSDSCLRQPTVHIVHGHTGDEEVPQSR